jgi:hypothetical protein
MVANFVGVLEGAREALRSEGTLSEEEINGGIDALERWSENPAAALWYATCWAEGIRQTNV